MRKLMRMVKRAVNLSWLQKERARQWLEENREAIEAYNERIRRDGPLNQDLTRFSRSARNITSECLPHESPPANA
jgi:hypothetical protein